MPQIGWFEIFIIVAVAIVVVGPKDFPVMLKKVGSWIGSVKRYVTNFQNEVSDIGNETIENSDKNSELTSKEKDGKKEK
tara:strand:- start:6091 stop:6327 length:237 start_codon:yes stop_codon:yes gene_type:complete